MFERRTAGIAVVTILRALCPVSGRQPTLSDVKRLIGDNTEIIAVIEITELHDVLPLMSMRLS